MLVLLVLRREPSLNQTVGHVFRQRKFLFYSFTHFIISQALHHTQFHLRFILLCLNVRMDVETFNLIVSITLIILTTAVLVVLAVIIRAAIAITRFVSKIEQRAEKLYGRAMNIERKIFINTWFWSKFIKSVVSSNFIRSVLRGQRDRN